MAAHKKSLGTGVVEVSRHGQVVYVSSPAG